MKEREENITLTSQLRNKSFKFNEKSFDQAKKLAESGFQKGADERFWDVKRDKAGNGQAKIRFMPDKNLNPTFHILDFMKHFFKGHNDKWFVANCPKTKNVEEPCPVCEMKLWEEENAAAVIKEGYWRNKSHFCNIYVIDDPIEPENNGKVFLYDVPNALLKKIKEKMHPSFAGEVPVNVFNPLESSNLVIRVTTESKNLYGKKVGVRNYDSTFFSEKCEPLGDDDFINGLWQKSYDLQSLLTEKKYSILTYDEIKKKLEAFLKGSPARSTISVGNKTSAVPDSTPEIKNVKDLLAKEEPKKEETKKEDPAATSAKKEDEEIQKNFEGITEKDAASEEIDINEDDIFSQD